MKKNLILLSSIVLMTLSTAAAEHKTFSLLSAPVWTLEVTNAIAYENLMIAAGGTNDVGVAFYVWNGDATYSATRRTIGTYTNADGTLAYKYKDILGWAPFTSENGSVPLSHYTTTGGGTNGDITTTWYQNRSLFFRLACGPGAEDTVVFTFAPVFKTTYPEGAIDATANLSRYDVNDNAALTVTLTGVASTVLVTNVPLPAAGFEGAAGIAWLRVTNNETAASGQVNIQNLSLETY